MTLELEAILLLAGIVGALLFLSGVALGLWVGELGRRRDAQRREGVIKVDGVERATVTPPGGGPPDGTMRELGEAPSTWIAETIADTGCTEEEAKAEWTRLLAMSMGDGGAGQGWMQE